MPKRDPHPPPPKRGQKDGGDVRKKAGGWQKPVKPPKQDSRPGGLPPKKSK